MVGRAIGPHAGTWHGDRWCRAPCSDRARWVGGPGVRAAVRPTDWLQHPAGPGAPAHRRQAWSGSRACGGLGSPALAGSGGGGCSLVGSMRWGGGELAVGVALQPPAALVDGPVVGPAQQGQVGQVGGAAVPPVAQLMGLIPGQGPGAAGEPTAAVAHGQGGPVGRPGRPGWSGPPPAAGSGPPPRIGGDSAAAAWSRPRARPFRSGPGPPAPPARSGLGPPGVPGRGVGEGAGVVGPVVGAVGVGDQPQRGHGPSQPRRVQPPAAPVRPRRQPGRPGRGRRAPGLPGAPPAPQDQDPFGPAAVGQPTNRLGGQLLELGHHRPSPSGPSVEWVFESMAATDQPPPQPKHHPHMWGQLLCPDPHQAQKGPWVSG
jgi:hypothetical protein